MNRGRGCYKTSRSGKACTGAHYAKQMCQKHYMLEWRGGSKNFVRRAERTHGERESTVIVSPLLGRFLLAGKRDGPRGNLWRQPVPRCLEEIIYQWSQWMLRRAHAGQLEAWEAKAVLEAWSESPGRLREAAMREPRGESMVPELEGATVEQREKTPLEEYADYWPGGYPWDNGAQPEATGGYRRDPEAPGTWGHPYPRPGVSWADHGLEPVPGSRPLPLTQYVTMVGLRNVDWSAIPAGRWEALGKPADADCWHGSTP